MRPKRRHPKTSTHPPKTFARGRAPRHNNLSEKNMNRAFFLQLLSASTLTLAGCGGGGAPPSVTVGGGDASMPSPVIAPTIAQLEGLWQSPAGAAESVSAVVLPTGQLWAIASNAGATRLIKASLSVKAPGVGGSGKSYTLGSGASAVSTEVSASVVEKSSLSGSFTAIAGQPEAFALAYQSRYDTPAVLGDFAGNWQATLGPGVVSWTISSAGALTGTRTTGCTYSGQLTLRAERKAVLDAAVSENCGGVVVPLAGVAVLGADKSRITVALTTADEVSGVALSLGQ